MVCVRRDSRGLSAPFHKNTIETSITEGGKPLTPNMDVIQRTDVCDQEEIQPHLLVGDLNYDSINWASWSPSARVIGVKINSSKPAEIPIFNSMSQNQLREEARMSHHCWT